MAELVTCSKIAPPGGHYSAAVSYGDTVLISGQLPITPDGTALAGQEFAIQAHQALDNFLAVAETAGANIEDILKVSAYIVGVENWPSFNQIFAERMGNHRPARAVIPVPELHYGCLIEVEGVAKRSRID